MNRPISGKTLRTNDLLFKIEVPKRTGRKRKRGSDGPFRHVNGDESPPTASKPSWKEACANSQLLSRSLQDNPESYKFEAIASIPRTVRYRGIVRARSPPHFIPSPADIWSGLADFQYSSVKSPFTKLLTSTVLSPHSTYAEITSFSFPPRPPASSSPHPPIPPAPVLTTLPIPLNYHYAQNPNIRLLPSPATGVPTLTNTSIGPVLLNIFIPFDHPKDQIPSRSSALLAHPSMLDAYTQHLLSRITALFGRRPIWTRRALANTLCIPLSSFPLKVAVQYVGYMFRSGPWREAVVRFGVDPRVDPALRIYQTVTFQMPLESKRKTYPVSTRAKPILRHIFTGAPPLHLDGRVTQICDITDPLLSSARLWGTRNIRPECDIRSDGWYCNGTMAKGKTIMKAKIDALLEAAKFTDAGGSTATATAAAVAAATGTGLSTDRPGLNLIDMSEAVPPGILVAEDFEKVLSLPDVFRPEETGQQGILDRADATEEEILWASAVRGKARIHWDDRGKSRVRASAKAAPGKSRDVADREDDGDARDGDVDGEDVDVDVDRDGDADADADAEAEDVRVQEVMRELERAGVAEDAGDGDGMEEDEVEDEEEEEEDELEEMEEEQGDDDNDGGADGEDEGE